MSTVKRPHSSALAVATLVLGVLAVGTRVAAEGPESPAAAALRAAATTLGASLAELKLSDELLSSDQKVHTLVRYVNETDVSFPADWETPLKKALAGKTIVLATDPDVAPPPRARLSIRIGNTKRTDATGTHEELHTVFELVSIERGEVEMLARAQAYSDGKTLAAAGSAEAKAHAAAFASEISGPSLAEALTAKLADFNPDAKSLGADKRARVMRFRPKNESDRHVNSEDFGIEVECAAFASSKIKLVCLGDPELDLLRARINDDKAEANAPPPARYVLRVWVAAEGDKLRGLAALQDKVARSTVLEAKADLGAAK